MNQSRVEEEWRRRGEQKSGRVETRQLENLSTVAESHSGFLLDS